MKARARLARRVLRDHRKGRSFHTSRDWARPPVEVWDFWACAHCPKSFLIPIGAPRAYK